MDDSDSLIAQASFNHSDEGNEIPMVLKSGSLKGACTLLAGMVLSGCGSNDTDTAGAPNKSRAAATVVVDGSSTVYRISKAAQEEFEAVNPEITVVVDNHGTGGGFSRYLQGEVDIVDASRTASPDEESKAKAQAIDWTRFFVGYDGITLVVNRKNTFVNSLTVDQLKRLWQPGSSIKTWKDLNESWPDRRIILYSPDNDSGTFEFFTEAIVGKAKSQREGVQQSSDDNTLVSGVANDEDGMGYFGYAYYAANKESLGAVAVQNGPDAKPVLPSPETIADQSYKPLSRPLFTYVKNSAARRSEVKQFLTFYLENVQKLAVKGGYDPPSADELKENADALAKLYPRAETAAPAPAGSLDSSSTSK
jgi:phosphate transport system substrate-binding protein